MVKNLPANAGDVGFIPGLGRFHTPRNNKACVPLGKWFCFSVLDVLSEIEMTAGPASFGCGGD